MSTSFLVLVVGSVGVFTGMAALYLAVKLLSVVVDKVEKGRE